jgi:hypothetical protein
VVVGIASLDASGKALKNRDRSCDISARPLPQIVGVHDFELQTYIDALSRW